jgi:hypothetical protein
VPVNVENFGSINKGPPDIPKKNYGGVKNGSDNFD